MATRGYVGVLNQDGSVDYIYNHFDSHRSGLGNWLNEHVTTEQQARDIIAQGDASSIMENCYYAQSGEKLTIHQIHSRTAFHKLRYYCYLFADGNWTVSGER